MERLAEARRAAGMTQQQLAAEANVALATVSKAEQGRYDPEKMSFGVLYALADALRVPVDWLAGYRNRDVGGCIETMTVEEAQQAWAMDRGLDREWEFSLAASCDTFSGALQRELLRVLPDCDLADLSAEGRRELTEFVVAHENRQWRLNNTEGYRVRLIKIRCNQIGSHVNLELCGTVRYTPV